MPRLRKIKRYGHTWVIKLEPNDMADLGLKDNDMVDIEDIRVFSEKK